MNNNDVNTYTSNDSNKKELYMFFLFLMCF